MGDLITRISRGAGWKNNHQSYAVQFQIDTKEWPWSKRTKKWSTSRTFDFNQYSEEEESAALQAAAKWQWGIETTGDPNICEIINDASKEDAVNG